MRKKVLGFITMFVMAFGICFVLPSDEVSAAGNIESAVQWAINKANDNSCGYSQAANLRWGTSYYDCSSFVITALKQGGFDVGGATYTQNMRSNLTTRGFEWIPWSSIGGSGNLKRGDILLNDSSDTSKQHTEFYIGNNQNVGAHTSKRAWNDQVSVSGYYNHPWTGVLRCNTTPDPPTSKWYDSFSPANLGDNREVFIQNPSSGAFFTVDGVSNGTNNVYGTSKGDTVYQLFKLKKQSDGSYKIALAQDGRCLEVFSGGNTGGTNISVYKETAEFINQKFYFYNINGLYYIRPVYSDLVLDMASGDNHNVAIWDYGSNWGPQMFKIIDVTHAPTWADLHTGNYRVNYNIGEAINLKMNADNATEYHVNVDKDSKRLFTKKVTTDNCSISLNESGYYTACVTARNSCGWVDSKYIGIRVLQPVDLGTDKDVFIQNSTTGKIFTVDQNSNGTENVYGADFINKERQLWKLKKQSDGSYRIALVKDGRCLEVFSGGTDNGTNISVYKETSEFSNQRFYIYNLYGAYYIKPLCSDNFVDMALGEPYNVATYGYADNWKPQMFNFITEVEKVCTHKWSTWSISKAATCSTEGSQIRKCTTCGKTETQTITKLTHNYVPTVVAPTCTTKGYTSYKCSLCGNTYTANETAAKGHSWSAWSVSKVATCSAEGSQIRKCTTCGKTETQTIAKPSHKYISTVVSPTTTEQGYTLHKCSECGDSYKDTYKSVKPSNAKLTMDKNAYAIGENVQFKFTSNAGKNYTVWIDDPNGKRLDPATNLTATYSRSFTTPGRYWVYVSAYNESGYCDTSKMSFEITCTHKWSDWSTIKAATCILDGQQTRKCSICGKEEIQTITKTGHHYEETVVPSTYTEQGYTLHKCIGCGDSYKDSYVAKKRGYDPNRKPVASEVKKLQQLLTKAVKLSDDEDIVDMFDANGDGKVNVIDVLILKRRALK